MNRNDRPPIRPSKILTPLALALALCSLPGRAAAQEVVPRTKQPPILEPTGALQREDPGLLIRPPGGARLVLSSLPGRWIGIKRDPDAPCPASRDWTAQPLFPPDPGQQVVPPGLRKFCLYKHSGSVPSQPQGLVAFAREGPAVIQPQPAASPSLLRTALPELEQRFLHHAGLSATPPPETPRVRLALLDTAPTSEDPAGEPPSRSPHGYTLASMARRLACSGGSCVAKVTSRLAMGRLLGSRPLAGPPDPRGGEAGTILDLAEAIRQEVVVWQSSGQPVLLLNLSLGWNGGRYGGLDPNIEKAPADVQAVHAALEDAVCHGVTVLAAAGNRSWGPDPGMSRGPLLPAAWEARSATCGAGNQNAGRPLVHAVGAVRADGAPLGNSRFDAEPRLVAFGDHAVVADRNGAPTAMLTGSSVSTVVAAAALAWVRHNLPAEAPSSAMERLYLSGADRRRPAAFPFAQPVRQVKVGTAGSFGTSVIRERVLETFGKSKAQLVGSSTGATRLVASPSSPIPPNLQYFDINTDVEVGSLPGSNPCTTCVFVPGGKRSYVATTSAHTAISSASAYIEIDSDYRGKLSSAVLQAGRTTYFLGDLTQGQQLVVVGLTVRSAADLQLSFLVDGRLSVTSLFFEP